MKTGEKNKKNFNESKLLIAIKIIPTTPKAAMVALNEIKIIPSGDVDYSDHFGTFSWLWRLKILDVLIHGKISIILIILVILMKKPKQIIINISYNNH